MGACGSDLLSKFGPQLAKLVSIEKAKEYLDDQVKKNKDKIFAEVKDIKEDIFKNLDDQQESLKQKLVDSAKEIDEQNKGALSKAASLQRKSIQEMVGRDQIDEQFKEVRNQLTQKFEQQQQNVINESEQFVQQTKDKMDEQKPNIPLFNQLPKSQQTKVMNEGEKKFKKQIQQEQKKTKNLIEDNLNPEKYTEIFKDLNPAQQISSISDQVDALIKNAQSMTKTSSFFC